MPARCRSNWAGLWRALGINFIILASVTGGLALIVTVVLGRWVRLHWGKMVVACMLTLMGAGAGWVGLWQAYLATLYVDNPTEDKLYVFADGELIASIKAGSHRELEIDTGISRVGWGSSKKKAKDKKRVSLERDGHYLLNPLAERCYLLVRTTYSTTGMGGADHDSVKALPDDAWQEVPRPDFPFRDNPESITTESNSSTVVALSLRRSLTCGELRSCSAAKRKKLWACYENAGDQEEVIECEQAARRDCGVD